MTISLVEQPCNKSDGPNNLEQAVEQHDLSTAFEQTYYSSFTVWRHRNVDIPKMYILMRVLSLGYFQWIVKHFGWRGINGGKNRLHDNKLSK